LQITDQKNYPKTREKDQTGALPGTSHKCEIQLADPNAPRLIHAPYKIYLQYFEHWQIQRN